MHISVRRFCGIRGIIPRRRCHCIALLPLATCIRGSPAVLPRYSLKLVCVHTGILTGGRQFSSGALSLLRQVSRLMVSGSELMPYSVLRLKLPTPVVRCGEINEFSSAPAETALKKCSATWNQVAVFLAHLRPENLQFIADACPYFNPSKYHPKEGCLPRHTIVTFRGRQVTYEQDTRWS